MIFSQSVCVIALSLCAQLQRPTAPLCFGQLPVSSSVLVLLTPPSATKPGGVLFVALCFDSQHDGKGGTREDWEEE